MAKSKKEAVPAVPVEKALHQELVDYAELRSKDIEEVVAEALNAYMNPPKASGPAMRFV